MRFMICATFTWAVLLMLVAASVGPPKTETMRATMLSSKPHTLPDVGGNLNCSWWSFTGITAACWQFPLTGPKEGSTATIAIPAHVDTVAVYVFVQTINPRTSKPEGELVGASIDKCSLPTDCQLSPDGYVHFTYEYRFVRPVCSEDDRLFVDCSSITSNGRCTTKPVTFQMVDPVFRIGGSPAHSFDECRGQRIVAGIPQLDLWSMNTVVPPITYSKLEVPLTTHAGGTSFLDSLGVSNQVMPTRVTGRSFEFNRLPRFVTGRSHQRIDTDALYSEIPVTRATLDGATGYWRANVEDRFHFEHNTASQCKAFSELSFSTSTGLVVTHGVDNQVSVWDTAYGRQVATTWLGPIFVNGVRLIYDSTVRIHACDGSTHLWNWRSGSLRRIRDWATGSVPELGTRQLIPSLFMGRRSLRQFDSIAVSAQQTKPSRQVSLRQKLIELYTVQELGTLKHLDFSSSGLSGTIPSEIGLLTSLTMLDLSTNYLNGPLPSLLGDMWNLQSLVLKGNSLSSAIPTELGMLTKLTMLDVSFNQLKGEVPWEILGLTSLSYLLLRSNKLSSMPRRLNGSGLLTLDIHSNRIAALPTQIGSLSMLTALDVGSNRISALPTRIGLLSMLTTLDVGSNRISGYIPAQLGNLVRLRSLKLDSNYFKGAIPENLLNLSSLTWLDLSGNRLQHMSREIERLTTLEMLELSGNELAFLPKQLGNLHSLRFLGVAGNFLGHVPELIKLQKLETLDLGIVQCDCQFLRWYPAYVFGLSSLRNLGHTICSSTNEFRGKHPSQLPWDKYAPCSRVTIDYVKGSIIGWSDYSYDSPRFAHTGTGRLSGFRMAPHDGDGKLVEVPCSRVDQDIGVYGYELEIAINWMESDPLEGQQQTEFSRICMLCHGTRPRGRSAFSFALGDAYNVPPYAETLRIKIRAFHVGSNRLGDRELHYSPGSRAVVLSVDQDITVLSGNTSHNGVGKTSVNSAENIVLAVCIGYLAWRIGWISRKPVFSLKLKQTNSIASSVCLCALHLGATLLCGYLLQVAFSNRVFSAQVTGLCDGQCEQAMQLVHTQDYQLRRPTFRVTYTMDVTYVASLHASSEFKAFIENIFYEASQGQHFELVSVAPGSLILEFMVNIANVDEKLHSTKLRGDLVDTARKVESGLRRIAIALNTTNAETNMWKVFLDSLKLGKKPYRIKLTNLSCASGDGCVRGCDSTFTWAWKFTASFGDDLTEADTQNVELEIEHSLLAVGQSLNNTYIKLTKIGWTCKPEFLWSDYICWTLPCLLVMLVWLCSLAEPSVVNLGPYGGLRLSCGTEGGSAAVCPENVMQILVHAPATIHCDVNADIQLKAVSCKKDVLRVMDMYMQLGSCLWLQIWRNWPGVWVGAGALWRLDVVLFGSTYYLASVLVEWREFTEAENLSHTLIVAGLVLQVPALMRRRWMKSNVCDCCCSCRQCRGQDFSPKRALSRGDPHRVLFHNRVAQIPNRNKCARRKHISCVLWVVFTCQLFGKILCAPSILLALSRLELRVMKLYSEYHDIHKATLRGLFFSDCGPLP